ncbi:gluconokinase [Chromobacterium violaceum]|nr:gluconokinase [Chromobacterium violaceum]ATP29316.1 gluconate kinase [Chromobacterium violaceum]ATP33223.1 gluconate kinase [Chromobacterium violaceum]KJH68349.1 gluconate kinase [Chromobacterium violaceum]KMN47889.1 gluconate kinase [Chromobacterium violaceum]KMN86615.1 gluconate kinase [Chromobacterium violaceum]
MKYGNIVVMGVAGCGKSSVGRLLAEAIGARFIEGDSFHPPENIQRMRAGIPLGDDDRAGWLANLAAQLRQGRDSGEPLVLACSALKRRYRDVLRDGDPGLRFVHLYGDKALIAERMRERSGHFMPESLLDSQFRDLEAPGADESAIPCDVSLPPEALLPRILAELG